MLYAKSIPEKTYDELMEDNLNKIPVYSDEWTNFNPADPGITILENLSAIQIIQQNEIDEVTPPVRAKLLKMLGYQAKRGRSSEIYLEALGLENSVDIPADQRFMVGDISFETTLPRHLTASHITGLFRKTDQEIDDFSHILDYEMTLQARPFGSSLKEGTALCFVMDAPLEAGERGMIYVTSADRHQRNPFEEDGTLSFATISWECFTVDGFVPLEVKDGTHGFVQSGYITVTQPDIEAAVYQEGAISGYVWRATLKKSEYDLAPSISQITGFLFPVYQKETKIITHSFQSASSVILNSALVQNGYIKVYAKEKKGTSYVEYIESIGQPQTGRFYRRRLIEGDKYIFEFDREAFGYAPGHLKNAVKVVIYNEEMMRKYYLGRLQGYDGQEFALPFNHVLTSTFSIIAEREGEDGEPIYDFLKPGRLGELEMSYVLYENEGKIRITDPGSYVGAKLYLGSMAVTLGPQGNVRKGNDFFPADLKVGQSVRFYNPTSGMGGRFQESFEDVRKRFIQDLNTPETAVVPSDYEDLIRRTPGLCIRKVRAWMDYARNEVQVVVLPDNEEVHPHLSDKYRKEIERWLEDRRLLCTRLRVRQPIYLPVFTSGTIYVKPHYEGCRKQIEEVICRNLDYVTGNQEFGQTLRFDRMFHEIESLDCVSYIYELSVNPQNLTYASMDGTDIVPAENCLLYPGNMKLDILPLPDNGK